jgi:predicted  nucleic acid-binding Zn-ribbon protein
MENQPEQTPKRNSNVIYFLIVVVVALLGTDVYLYLQKNKSDVIIVTQTDEKSRLNTELDSLEAQVEQVNASKTKMSTEMQAKNDSLQSRIKVLRTELKKGTLTKAELVEAQENVKQLRYFVAKYTNDIDSLQKTNASLKTERDTIKKNLAIVSSKADTLSKQNKDLNNKVVIASALKVGEVGVSAYKIKSSGKEVEVTRASPAKKLKISFTVASNAIAQKGLHTVYIRIMDPTGNQITATDSGPFSADGQDLQYTYKTSIDFKDDGAPYSVDWINEAPFVKGAYTVVLYADGYTMGKSSVMLK